LWDDGKKAVMKEGLKMMWKNNCLILYKSTAPSPLGEGEGG
jgi:hypothetical protein